MELLELAAHWADLHAVLPGQEPARVVVPGTQRLVRLAGDGTPEVAEFAPAELGAALGVSSFAGACLVGDALELRHRLPRCWTRARAGRLQAWRARRIADATKILPPEGAAWVDAQVVSFADKVGSRRLTDLVAVALVRFDPDEAARRAAAARDRRGVRLGDDMHGNRSVAIEADPLDVAVFDRTITAIADALAGEGDTDPVQARRAKAIGLIADPDHVLRLLHDRTEPTPAPNTGSSPAPDTGSSSDESAPASTQPASTQPAGRPDRSRTRRSPWGAAKPVLYLHPDAHTLATQGATAVVRVEDAGMLLAGQIREWLGRTDLTIQPVLDLADTTAVDAYECPDRVTEIVTLRNPCCPFP